MPKKTPKTGHRVKAGFGLWLEQLRKNRGLTLQDVADRAGMSVMAIWLIETGDREPLLSTAKKLAQVYGVSGNVMFDHYQSLTDEELYGVQDGEMHAQYHPRLDTTPSHGG